MGIMRHITFFRGSVSAVAVLAALAVAGTAAAQDDTAGTVDSLIVTAQKREQNLQDVPVTVTSVSAALLEAAGVRDIKDLTILTPGLTVTSTTNETITSARIRGVGTVGDNPGLESSVGVVIDGVYRARNGVGFGDLGELERIEVLKGPQGTLFGKNTSAGVINIITKAPSFDPEFNGELTFGNYDGLGFSGSITGPLVEDKLAARLYVAHRERGGFYDVITGDGPRTRSEDQTQNFGTVRGQLLFVPTEAIELRLTADYTTRSEFCCTGVQIRSGPTSAIVNALASGGQGVRPVGGATFPVLPFSRTAYANNDTPQNVKDGGVSLQADIDLPSLQGSLTSVTALRSWKSNQGMDVDFTGADILYRRPENYGFGVNTFTQELRLAGETERLNWLVGGFYASEELKRDDEYVYGADYNAYFSLLLASQLGLSGTPIAPALVNCLTGNFPTCAAFGRVPGATFVPGPGFVAGPGARDNYKQDSSSFAFFTNNSFKVTEQFEITAGLRYTSEDKDLHAIQTNAPGSSNACGAAIGRINSPQWNAGIPLASQPAIAGAICTNWANPAFNNRTTDQSASEEQWSGTIKGAYRFNDDFMTYASYARGYKAGGFNLDRQTTNLAPDASTAFPAETVDSYELGVKTTWLNNSLLLNATGFIQQFKDFQLNTFAGVAFIVESIPELESRGVDVDLIWFSPMPGLNFQGGVTYAKTEYGDFGAADLMVPGRFPALSLLPGSQMSFAPEWSSSAAVDYTHDIGSTMKAKFNLSAKYVSQYNTGSDLLPFKVQEGYTLVNGRIVLAEMEDHWAIELWGQNLADTEYKQVAYNGPIQGTFFQSTVTATGPYAGTYYNPALDTGTYDAFLGQPRTYGVTLRTKF
jgi:iron complex outermembrane receptor protein